MHLVVIADVGGEDVRHIGDEAMLEANLDAFRQQVPGITFTVVSRDPQWAAARYGTAAVPPFGFRRDGTIAARRALLARLLETADHPAARAVAQSDGLVISGGGNLASPWPDLLYERVALLHLARRFDKPAVVLGQTIGPSLAGAERELLAETLPYARFVGARELPTAALALALGVAPERVWYQPDDALAIDDHVTSPSTTPYIAVTIASHVRGSGPALSDALARQLRELSIATNLPLVLVPHAWGAATASDITESEILAARIALPQTSIAADLDTPRARQLAAGASLIVSSRYHPIVFGVAAGVPSIGIYGDEYCRIKLQGALEHARQRTTMTFDNVTRGQLLPVALQLLASRDEVRATVASRQMVWRDESIRRWAAIERALDPGATIEAAPATLFGHPAGAMALELATALEARREAWQWEQETLPAKLAADRALPRRLRRLAARLLRR